MKTYELCIESRSVNPKYQDPRQEKFLVLKITDRDGYVKAAADIRISELAIALQHPEE